MTFTDDIWRDTAPLMRAIHEHPFVRALGDGSLERDTFRRYMTQDALYLAAYARAMASLAILAPTTDDTLWWLESARDAIVVERALHAGELGSIDEAAVMSPTCRGYTDFLQTTVATRGYAVGVAAVLPCFWIYADVGQQLLERAGDLSAHPYGEWIGTYADESFAQAVEKARTLANQQAATVSADTVAEMAAAYTTAARFEWMFWDAAWRGETWPV